MIRKIRRVKKVNSNIKISRGYCGIGLFQPKNSINVGSVLRSAGIYGASFVAVTGGRIPFKYKKSSTDTMKHYRHLPLIQIANLKSIIPFDCVPVAIELIDGAKTLPEYKHPERAFYIFGPEDGTLGKNVLRWCRDIVYIPTNGCMNLACCVNVVLYDRMSKKLTNENQCGKT